MSKFNAGQSFADGDTVTGAKLNNITGLLDIYTGLISEQTAMSATVSTADQLLIADTDNGDSGAANRVTIQKLLNDTLTNGTYTNANLTGTITSNRTVATSATITTGTIPTLVATTLITTGTGTAAAPAIVPTGDTNTGIFFPAADTIAFSEGGVEAMRIDSSGNVGIGTTSPTRKLHVVGPAANGAGNEAILINANSVQLAVRRESGGAGTIELGTPNNHNLGIFTNGTVGAYFASGGNVGIGTTSPSAQLELSTDSAKKPSTNTWTIASDQRLKTNITNADNDRCYEIVKQVPLKRYTWKSEVYSQEQVKDRSKLGWIAQDVEAVFPKAVGTNRFAYNQVFEDVVTPELDSDGNTVLDENGVAKTKTEKRLVSEDVIEDCKDLNSDQIYAAMYGTIQKLIEKVESLESKVAALEAA